MVDGNAYHRSSACNDGSELSLHSRCVYSHFSTVSYLSGTYTNVATSTDVERAFSRGGLTVSKMRHALSDESTRAATVLGSWAASFSDLIPHADIVTLFKDKSKRSGKGKSKEGSSTSVVPVDSNDLANVNMDN